MKTETTRYNVIQSFFILVCSDKKNKSRLFDLKEDPHEKNNIVAEKPNVVQQMEDLLVKHRKNEYDFEGYSDDEKMNLKIKDELKKMGYI